MAGSDDSTRHANRWLDMLADEGHDPTPPDLLAHGSMARPHDPAAYARLAHGADDPVGPADPLAQALRGRALTVARCDHFALLRRFEAIEATLDFLRQLS